MERLLQYSTVTITVYAIRKLSVPLSKDLDSDLEHILEFVTVKQTPEQMDTRLLIIGL